MMTMEAIVKRKRKKRRGKGFSREELKEVGLSCTESLKLEIPIDARRSTKHKENVKALKAYISQRKIELPIKEKRVELTEVKGIGPKTAGKLVEAGIKNAYELAASNPEKVAEALGSSKDRAINLIEGARATMNEE